MFTAPSPWALGGKGNEKGGKSTLDKGFFYAYNAINYEYYVK